jgi:hypothetical protein
MARPQISDGGEGLQIYSVAASTSAVGGHPEYGLGDGLK